MSLSRRLSTIAIAALTALLVAACGGDGSPDDTPPDTAADVTSEPTSDDPEDAASACAAQLSALASAQADYTAEMSALMSGDTPDAGAAISALQELADAAPAEVEADFRVLADELGGYLTAAADSGLLELDGEPTEEQLAEIQALEGTIDTAALEEAQANIDAYFAANC